MWITSSLSTALTPTAIALGNFDGIHRGHCQVIAPVVSTATRLRGVSSTADIIPVHATVVTFSPHPQEFFSGQLRTLLTPQDEKVAALAAIGVDQLVPFPFTRELANLSPQEFVEAILLRGLQARQVSVGADFRFGHKRLGTAEDLQTIAATFGIEVVIVPLQTFQGTRISSSAIRQVLQDGDVQQAQRMLGRPYRLIGEVVSGQQLGRTIGFPTANLYVASDKFVPRLGVYSVRVSIRDGETGLLGVMNIGNRPTVDGTRQTIEVHLLDWSGDLYGRTLSVELEQFIRPEQKFASLDDLKAQIHADCETARTMVASVS